MFTYVLIPAYLLVVLSTVEGHLRGANLTASVPKNATQFQAHAVSSASEDTPVEGEACYACDFGQGKWQYYAGQLSCLCQSCDQGAHMVDMQCLRDPMGTGSTYRLTNSYSDNKFACLDAHEQKATSDGTVVAYPCPPAATGCDGNTYPGYDRQSWVAEQTQNGVFRLTNSASGQKMCLDRHFEEEGMHVIMAPCDGNGGDEWEVVGFPDSTTTQFRNTRFGKPLCLAFFGDFRYDAPGFGETVGATVCDDNDPKQMWTIEGC